MPADWHELLAEKRPEGYTTVAELCEASNPVVPERTMRVRLKALMDLGKVERMKSSKGGHLVWFYKIIKRGSSA